MKQALTIKEVLQELRAQVRIYRTQEKVAGDVVTRTHIRYAIKALTYAIAAVREKQVTRKSLQRAADKMTRQLQRRAA